jgi:hypothetical protein
MRQCMGLRTFIVISLRYSVRDENGFPAYGPSGAFEVRTFGVDKADIKRTMNTPNAVGMRERKVQHFMTL